MNQNGSRVRLRPLGGRVIIRPERTDPIDARTGLELVKGWEPEQRGTVVTVTPGNYAKAADIASRLALRHDCEFDATICEAVNYLQGLSRTAEIHAGDDVLFSWQAGQEIWIDEGRERLLILREDDVIAVVEP